MRIAVVGMGRQGLRRANALSTTEGVEAIYAVDTDLKRLLGIPFLGVSMGEAIECCEAIAVCVPTTLHEKIASWAIDAGKHVLIEKPLTLDSQSAWNLVQKAEEKGVALHVGLNMRYRTPVLAAKDEILFGRHGGIGRPKLITARIGHSQFVGKENDPRFLTSGGPLADIGTHVLDLALQLLYTDGSSLSVSRRHSYYVRQVFSDCWNSTATLEGRDESSVALQASYTDYRQGVGSSINIAGTDGNIRINMGDPDDSITVSNKQGIHREEFAFPDDCWKLDCEAFVESCRTLKTNARDAAALVELLQVPSR